MLCGVAQLVPFGQPVGIIIGLGFLGLPLIVSFMSGPKIRCTSLPYGEWQYLFYLLKFGILGGFLGGLMLMLFSPVEQNFFLGIGATIFADTMFAFRCWYGTYTSGAPKPGELRPYVKYRWERSWVGRFLKRRPR